MYCATPNLRKAVKTVRGPLIEQIDKAKRMVLDELTQGITLSGSGFKTRHLYPERVVFEYVQAADFDRLKMVLKSLARASFRRCAASLSLIARASASSCWKVIPGLRNCSAKCSDLNFS